MKLVLMRFLVTKFKLMANAGPKWFIQPELVPVSAAWSDKEYYFSPPEWDASLLQSNPPVFHQALLTIC